VRLLQLSRYHVHLAGSESAVAFVSLQGRGSVSLDGGFRPEGALSETRCFKTSGGRWDGTTANAWWDSTR
jgi:hypothetical protein